MAGIDLSAPFVGDTHETGDGPYEALLRTRKWMFATGATLLVLGAGWFDFDEAAKALKFSSLSKETFHIGVTWAAILLGVQIAILLVQAGLGYFGSLWHRAQRFQIPGRMDWDVAIAALRAEEDRAQANADSSDRLDKKKEWMDKVEAAQRDIKMWERMMQLANERWGWAKLTTMVLEIARDLVRLLPTLVFFVWCLAFYAKFGPSTPTNPAPQPAAVNLLQTPRN